ncbi:MAG: translation initiation factor IF-2 [bacterium]
MAKRRVYEIAKERDLTTQELVEQLRAAGLEVKSSVSSVEEADVERALAPKGMAAAGKSRGSKKPAAKSPASRGGVAKAAATKAPKAEKAPRAKTSAESKKTAKRPRTKAGAGAPTVEAGAAIAEPTKADVSKEAATKRSPTRSASPKAAPKKSTPAASVAAKPAAAKSAVEKPADDRAPDAGQVQVTEPAEATPESSERPAPGSPAVIGGPPEVRVEAVRPEEGRSDQARREVPRPEDAGSAPRKPPRPRGRGPRLEDMPTVVGPGVPLRRGVKPSGNVVSKEELARIQAEKAAKAGAARKAAAEAPAKPAQAASPATGPGRPGARPAAPAGPSPPAPGGFARDPGERRERPSRSGSTAAPEARGEQSNAAPPVAPARAGGPSRVRRGDDKPSKRRVIIDSQAGRKGGKGGFRDRRAGPVSEAEKPVVKKKAPPGTESVVRVKSGASVKDLGDALEVGAGELIKTLIKLGEMVTITQSLSDDAIMILAEEFERQVEIEHAEEEKESVEVFVDDPADLSLRAPVVTIMGHVDHGKTSLLDAVRETEVVKSEAGGITQHIGAYQVTHKEKKVTFLDTPGHEAFTAMRARGARSTDIAVIVVAADDGVMPQTLEAISHAKAAEVPMVVAINKMDLPDANPDLVKKQLADEGLVPEAWGGDTVMVEVSAKQQLNLGDLMDMILLVAEVQELRANANAPASGVVIEAQLDVGRGPVATMLVQRGTLRVGDAIASGESYGKVKAMFDFTGKALAKAGPSVPVQILGFSSLPVAGDFVLVARDEREARQKAEQRTTRLRQEQLAKSRVGASSLEEFYRRLKEGRVKELPLVIKGDVGGSVEALEEALRNITHPEVKVAVIFAGVGGINESDILLAAASKAVVIGFNVRPSVAAKALAEQEHVDVRTYRVIYKAIEDVEAALVGMLEPERVEEELGTAEVRQVFRASRIGTIAGCYVQTGKMVRSAKMRLVRNGSIVHEGAIGSLKRFADDVREVQAGYECGLHLDGYDDIHEGDVIEAYEIKEVARTQ